MATQRAVGCSTLISQHMLFIAETNQLMKQEKSFCMLDSH